jgi:hypothetical protein
MKLDSNDARSRLASHDHAILCTLHPDRGVDAVPVAYAIDDDGYVGIPVDLVKPKASLRLQRERNLEADPRATLLVEHWDRDDWSMLWWVRADALSAISRSAIRPGARASHRRHQRLGGQLGVTDGQPLGGGPSSQN